MNSNPTFDTLLTTFPVPADDAISYRPAIFWAMNDKLERPVLEAQLDGFAKCGYGGVMVHAWGGLPNAFMDDAWLDSVAEILAHAATLSLDVWIWDDWLFGSGSAGGKVTANPRYRAKTLRTAIDIIIEAGESIAIPVPARTLATCTFAINKFGNRTGATTAQSSTVGDVIGFTAEVRSRLVVVGWQTISGMFHTTRSHAVFLDPDVDEAACDIYHHDDKDVWSVDMLNLAATKEYLNQIHERYRVRVSEYFGNTLKGFFYDEPKAPSPQPWTDDFAERFAAIKGYDLTPFLPDILIDIIQDGATFNRQLREEAVQRAAADYRDVWTTLIAESFYRPIQDWCRKHGVVATGHQLGDNSFDEMFTGGGLFHKNLAYSDLPGVDSIAGQITPGTFVDSPRYAGSIAAGLGLNRSMSESFAVYGHGITLDQMRYVCEHQVVRGLNLFFCMVANYNREKSFHFHPPELSDFNPVIKQYGSVFSAHIENTARLLNGGQPDCLVRVLNRHLRENNCLASVMVLASDCWPEKCPKP